MGLSISFHEFLCQTFEHEYFFLRLKKILGGARIFFSGLLNKQEYFHSIFLAPEFFWFLCFRY